MVRLSTTLKDSKGSMTIQTTKDVKDRTKTKVSMINTGTLLWEGSNTKATSTETKIQTNSPAKKATETPTTRGTNKATSTNSEESSDIYCLGYISESNL